jgi:hypothetical protein
VFFLSRPLPFEVSAVRRAGGQVVELHVLFDSFERCIARRALDATRLHGALHRQSLREEALSARSLVGQARDRQCAMLPDQFLEDEEQPALLLAEGGISDDVLGAEDGVPQAPVDVGRDQGARHRSPLAAEERTQDLAPAGRVREQALVREDERGQLSSAVEGRAHVPFPEGEHERLAKPAAYGQRPRDFERVTMHEDEARGRAEDVQPKREENCVAGIFPGPSFGRVNHLRQRPRQLAQGVEGRLPLPSRRERRRRGPRSTEPPQQLVVEERKHCAFPVPGRILGRGRHQIGGTSEGNAQLRDGLRRRRGPRAVHSDDENRPRGSAGREGSFADSGARPDGGSRRSQAPVRSRLVDRGDPLVQLLDAELRVRIGGRQ